jgi:hypothetical protein
VITSFQFAQDIFLFPILEALYPGSSQCWAICDGWYHTRSQSEGLRCQDKKIQLNDFLFVNDVFRRVSRIYNIWKQASPEIWENNVLLNSKGGILGYIFLLWHITLLQFSFLLTNILSLICFYLDWLVHHQASSSLMTKLRKIKPLLLSYFTHLLCAEHYFIHLLSERHEIYTMCLLPLMENLVADNVTLKSKAVFLYPYIENALENFLSLSYSCLFCQEKQT